MNVGEILEDFGYQFDDVVEPYLVGQAERMANLNQAYIEACRRLKATFETDNDDICKIDVIAGQSVYRLDPRVIRVECVYHEGKKRVIQPISSAILNTIDEGWRTRTGTIENYVIGMDPIRTLRLFKIPTENQTLLS